MRKVISINDKMTKKIVQALNIFGMHPECIKDDIVVPEPEYKVSKHIVDSIKKNKIEIDTDHIILGV